MTFLHVWLPQVTPLPLNNFNTNSHSSPKLVSAMPGMHTGFSYHTPVADMIMVGNLVPHDIDVVNVICAPPPILLR